MLATIFTTDVLRADLSCGLVADGSSKQRRKRTANFDAAPLIAERMAEINDFIVQK